MFATGANIIPPVLLNCFFCFFIFFFIKLLLLFVNIFFLVVFFFLRWFCWSSPTNETPLFDSQSERQIWMYRCPYLHKWVLFVFVFITNIFSIDMPLYPTKENMKQMLNITLEYGNDVFGIV
jgi:hypothetical protein